MCQELPGNCIRGRWGRIHSIETIFRRGFSCIWDGFNKLCVAAPASRKPKGIGADEDQAYREKIAQTKQTALLTLQSVEHEITLAVSHISKEPLMHFFYWAEKRMKEVNSSRKLATASGTAFLGPTMLSDMVSFKEVELRSDIAALLTPQASTNPLIWGNVWDIVPQVLQPFATRLIVEVVLSIAASWQFRYTNMVNTSVMQLLLLVAKPPHITCERRQRLAQWVMHASDDDLFCPQSDIALKLRALYMNELTVVSESGMVPLNLFNFIALWRSGLPDNTQVVEGT